MNNTPRFLLIDDDPFNNFLSRALIDHLNSGIDIESFKDPDEAMKYIETAYSQNDNRQTIILLDINLPRMMSWEFIEKFKKQPEGLRSWFDIYILSSSIDGRDKTRVASNPVIKGYFQKPLEKEVLKELVSTKAIKGAV